MQDWIKETCTNKPNELDFNSSKESVIQRRNIVEVIREEEDYSIIEYECEMRILTVNEWQEISQKENEELRQIVADLTETVLLGGM